MLDEIIRNKRREVEKAKKKLPLSSFKSKIEKPKRDFKKALSKDRLSIIAEIKRKSPSKTVDNANIGIGEVVAAYNKYADAISVLTDKKYFDGTLEDLREVDRMTRLPVLRKDFIVDEYQIYESRYHGADAILLIASALSDEEIKRFIDIAGGLGMACLVEVHTEKELERAMKLDARIVGVNNRNLKTLEVDTDTALRLMQNFDDGRIYVCESGIKGREYLAKIRGRFNAILVGTLFMNSDDVEKEILGLR